MAESRASSFAPSLFDGEKVAEGRMRGNREFGHCSNRIVKKARCSQAHRCPSPVASRHPLPARGERKEKLERGEGEFAGGIEGEFEGDFGVVAAAEFEGCDLERAGDGAEVGDHDLPGPYCPIKNILAHERVGG